MQAMRSLPFDVATTGDGDAPTATYRCGEVVEVVLTDADPATRRRLVDFFAGVTFALEGRIEILGPTRFRLIPSTADEEPDWTVYAPERKHGTLPPGGRGRAPSV